MSEGLTPPTDDGKVISLQDLKRTVAAFPEIRAEWSEGPEFYDGVVSSKSGLSTKIIIGNPGAPLNHVSFILVAAIASSSK